MNYKMIGKRLIRIAFPFFIGIFLVNAAYSTMLPDNIQVFSNETKTLNLPLKDVTISVLDEKELMVGGHSVGIRMDVSGVLIVGLEEIQTKAGAINPGLLAGLQIGDSVLSINGKSVASAYDVQRIVNNSKTEVLLRIKRKNEFMNIKVSPVKSTEDQTYKLGVWVKEKTAGLGTVTYYDPSNHVIGALGHGITEVNSGEILKVADGQLIFTKVESILQGKSGKPGEIRGIFYEADNPMGELYCNSEFGVFGTAKQALINDLYPKKLKIGYQDEIKKGKASILTTINGNKIEEFEIEIEKINKQSKPNTKGMVIRVTDERLLKQSGGIVQGMSGSPIIQDGKIIGAVTHVLINDPEQGYGIFIEWMLKKGENAMN